MMVRGDQVGRHHTPMSQKHRTRKSLLTVPPARWIGRTNGGQMSSTTQVRPALGVQADVMVESPSWPVMLRQLSV